MNRNEKIIKTTKTIKFTKFRKAVITASLVATVIATSTISVYADAPAGVDTTSMGGVMDIIFWIVGIAIGASALIPGLYHISQGVSNDDPRTRNGGIAACAVGIACIVALPAIKALFM
ncbi:MAG: hypothetical protein UD936_03565 [Acutalibacteraceae bacterium]|nr:hypothetical protein [Acutalibacteraceae bacterium]